MKAEKKLPWYCYLWFLIPIMGICFFVSECEKRGLDWTEEIGMFPRGELDD